MGEEVGGGERSEGGRGRSEGVGEEVRGTKSEGSFEKNEPGTHLEPVDYVHKLANCVFSYFSIFLPSSWQQVQVQFYLLICCNK